MCSLPPSMARSVDRSGYRSAARSRSRRTTDTAAHKSLPGKQPGRCIRSPYGIGRSGSSCSTPVAGRRSSRCIGIGRRCTTGCRSGRSRIRWCSALRMAIDVVAGLRIAVPVTAIGRTIRPPPAADEHPGRAAVDAPVGGATEDGVAVRAFGVRTAHCGIGRHRAQDEVEWRGQQCRADDGDPGQEGAAAVLSAEGSSGSFGKAATHVSALTGMTVGRTLRIR